MSAQPLSPRTAALVGGVFFAVIVAALWLFSPILLPFVAGIVSAYLLDPLVDRCERTGMGRGISATLVLTGGILITLAAALLLLPTALDQGAALAQSLPLLIEKISILADDALRALGKERAFEQPAIAEMLFERVGSWIPKAFERFFSSVAAIANLFGLFVITPIVTWYLLRDWDVILQRIDELLPRPYVKTIRTRAREIHDVLAGFVRGQVLVCAMLAGFYAISLGLIGVPDGVFIGLFAGIISFVPYAGTIIGVVLALGLSWFSFGLLAWETVAVAIVFFFGQMSEEYLLRPRIIGEKTGLHPVWTFFALFAGGYLFGFVGLLLAVPTAAVIAVLLRAGITSYRSSRFYGDAER